VTRKAQYKVFRRIFVTRRYYKSLSARINSPSISLRLHGWLASCTKVCRKQANRLILDLNWLTLELFYFNLFKNFFGIITFACLFAREGLKAASLLVLAFGEREAPSALAEGGFIAEGAQESVQL